MGGVRLPLQTEHQTYRFQELRWSLVGRLYAPRENEENRYLLDSWFPALVTVSALQPFARSGDSRC